ncbi:MAG TPA: elongation factor G [Gammaproteobacteria bacterium]|nr:elongation factor G [Gammaproteobacteria bacterium]
MTVTHTSSPRVALICGPYLSGKSTLLEAMLSEAGSLQRHNPETLALADNSPEARAHEMSTEMNIASTDYLGEPWTFIDCPGLIELQQETRSAATIADIAVVVCEPDPGKSTALTATLQILDEADVPHLLFINKFDKEEVSARHMLETFQAVSRRPLVLREIPIREHGKVIGHVDLVSERAFRWEEGKPSSLLALPEVIQDREEEARTTLFESLADFDDDLLEKLLEDVIPSNDDIYSNLSKNLSSNLVVPVLFGSATHGNGIRRLMKALRHEAPDITTTNLRLAVGSTDGPVVRVFKTVNAGHAGKISIGRVLTGTLKDGDTLNGQRAAGMSKIFGPKMERLATAEAGDVIGFGKLDGVITGDRVTGDGKLISDNMAAPTPPPFALAIRTENRGDDVKLPDNLQKILDEDLSLSAAFDERTGEFILYGQGDMHLRLALEKLKNRSGLTVNATVPTVAYRETLRKTVEKRVRHKKQSGGHGEFGEVLLRVSPRKRGEGFIFSDKIHGGVVPKQYIPAVEAGVIDAMREGPLGFPLVDLEVVLTDGKFHAVDSSEMAFRKAGSQAIREAIAESGTVLLEPINNVGIVIPNEHTPRIQKLVSGRRGQILGFDTCAHRQGWDEVSCQIPAAEMQDMIQELRSATMGVGSYESSFDHLQQLSADETRKIVAT